MSHRWLEAFARQMLADPERLVRLAKEPLRRLVEDYLDQE